MANLAGWPYWKVISITGQAGAGTDYQVELEIGDSAGGDFHLEGHCTNFPQDIRITDDDGTTLLDHWVEDITADPIVVHVEVKDDLGSNQDIRVYYGKNGETTASNGANTFLQFHGSASAQYLDALNTPPTCIYESKAKVTNATHTIRFGVSSTQDFDNGDSFYIMSVSATSLRYLRTMNSGSESSISEAPEFTNNTYYNLKIINTGSAVTGFVSGNQIGSSSITTNLPDINMGLGMEVAVGTATQDWSFARKYNSPEPAFSSAGAEQSPTGVSPTGVFYGPLFGPFGGPL